jgi:hypothetical protein
LPTEDKLNMVNEIPNAYLQTLVQDDGFLQNLVSLEIPVRRLAISMNYSPPTVCSPKSGEAGQNSANRPLG